MPSPPTVLVAGCGIAGPVLSLLLKEKGYRTIVFEKVRTLGEAGGSLILFPNGLKVINLINGIEKLFEDTKILPLSDFWYGTDSGETLAHNSLGSSFEARYGQPGVGVKRTTLNLQLKAMLLDADIEIHEGHELVDIQEGPDSVTAHFSNGKAVTGSFLIGCDGIKAASRRILLQNLGSKEGAPMFTGLTQTCGMSKTPRALAEKAQGLRNWFGAGVHFVSYPVSTTHTSWAITLPQATEKRETWKLASEEELQAQKEMLETRLEGFEPAVLGLVSSAERIVSFGLFDRPELEMNQWFSKRCVLVGDAAHPTSPHLGQGANQALEDCYHLTRLLPQIDESFKNEHIDLAQIFEEYAQLRQPRTSALVRGARKMGEQRVVVGGPELCRQRDAQITASLGDIMAVQEKNDELYLVPF